MKKRTLSSTWPWAGLLLSLLALDALVAFVPGLHFAKAMLGFWWLFLVPGWLIIRTIKLKTPAPWQRISYSVGFSLLVTMLGGLAINATLPLLGISDPLHPAPLLAGFNLLWLGLFTAARLRNRQKRATLRFKFPPKRDLLTTGAGLPIIGLSILGAISLNNNGTGIITLGMLVYAIGYLAFLLWQRHKLSETAILTGLYIVALSLLLMTSLRGWLTAGHDVQREYRVFLLTLQNLQWSPNHLKDAYNACLSITILPTAIRQIMGVPELYVYKTVFQAIFALVPIMVYLISRRFMSVLISMLATIYFIAFPTYFSDMPMLNRQEMAFLFIALALLTLFNSNWSRARQRWLVCLFGVGVIISHYSTTYIMLAMLLLVVVLRYLLKAAAKFYKRVTHRAPRSLERWRTHRRGTVGLIIVAVLLGASHLWSTEFTGTGSNITRVINQTVQMLNQDDGAKDTKSSDTKYSLVGQGRVTDQDRLDLFAQHPVSRDGVSPPQTLYPKSIYARYPINVAPSNALPLTAAGRTLADRGIPVTTLHTIMRTGSALFLQLMLVLGIAILFLTRQRRRTGNEYRLLQLASLVILGAIIVLPVLSAEYGLLRAFQQALLLGGAAIAIGTLAIIPTKWRWLKSTGIVIALTFFASSTGIITTALGGYPGQMHLANSGKYYDLYYAHNTEQAGIDWLTDAATRGRSREVMASVDADRFLVGRTTPLAPLDLQNEVYPALIRKEAYIFLGYTATTKREATLYYNNDPITYRYPIEFVDGQKDLVYSNRGVRIYR